MANDYGPASVADLREDDLSLHALKGAGMGGTVGTRVVRAAPLRISVVGNLPGDKQIQMQTEMSGATSEEIDGLLDDLVGRLDRQTAKASLEAHEEAFRKAGVALGTMIAALPIAEKNFIASLEGLKAEIEEQGEKAMQVRAQAEKAWRDSGRLGEPELQGNAEFNMKRIAKANKETRARIEKLGAERKAEMSQALQNIEHARMDVLKQRAKIDELRQMAGKPPVSDATIDSYLTCELPKIED